MSGNQYIFAVVDIASWEFSGENDTTRKNILLSWYADLGIDG